MIEIATFAGGCFWCMEPPFEKLDGMKSVVSGYAGGSKDSPTYKEVSGGKTDYVESVQVKYDSKKISYNQLLDIFWRNIDPTQKNGQFNDIGAQYRTVIFYHNENQKKKAEQSKKKIGVFFDQPIVTEISPVGKFFQAEEYHQDYYKKNPLMYKLYRLGSGRDHFIKNTWSKPSLKKNDMRNSSFLSKDLKKARSQLTRLQFDVTQKDKTEPPFKNKYWDHYEKGIYVDVVSKEPLFSSTHKFKSGTGWPSFTEPIDSQYIQKKDDHKFFIKRTEVRSKIADSHLGHVFKDGPTGTRYCINSASLSFIPFDQLKKQGYDKFVYLFQ